MKQHTLEAMCPTHLPLSCPNSWNRAIHYSQQFTSALECPFMLTWADFWTMLSSKWLIRQQNKIKDWSQLAGWQFFLCFCMSNHSFPHSSFTVHSQNKFHLTGHDKITGTRWLMVACWTRENQCFTCAGIGNVHYRRFGWTYSCIPSESHGRNIHTYISQPTN